VKLTVLGFVVSFAIAILIGIGLRSGGFLRSPLFVAIVLVATSLGVATRSQAVARCRELALLEG
jgi:hypothetical protein